MNWIVKSFFLITVTCLFSQQTNAQSKATDRIELPVPGFSLFATTPNFGEGLVFDRQGNLFVSDAFRNLVLKIDETGSVVEWSAAVRAPNGHKILSDGSHVVAEGGLFDDPTPNGAIVHLDGSGNVIKRLTHDENGDRLRWPNDIAVDRRNGGFYFTDPGRFMGNEPGRIYYVDENFEISTVSSGELDFPNGIVISEDGSRLYVAESLQNRVVVFDLTNPDVRSAPSTFVELPSNPNHWTNGEAEPDGLALDTSGNLYVAHFGAGLVRVYSSRGEYLGSLASGSGTVTNLAFKPQKPNELYVYSAKGLSFAEIGEGGNIVRFTLKGVNGLALIETSQP